MVRVVSMQAGIPDAAAPINVPSLSHIPVETVVSTIAETRTLKPLLSATWKVEMTQRSICLLDFPARWHADRIPGATSTLFYLAVKGSLGISTSIGKSRRGCRIADCKTFSLRHLFCLQKRD